MCDKGQGDNRLIYPDVQAPDHFDAVRRNPQSFHEEPDQHSAPVHSSFAADTEASFCESLPSQRESIVARSQEDDIDKMTQRLTVEEANLAKWRMKLRKCSVCLKVFALLFMFLSAYHLLFPPSLEKMLMHGKRGHHDRDPRRSGERNHPGRHHENSRNNWVDQEFEEDSHHGRHLEHDDDFFVVKRHDEPRRSNTVDSQSKFEEDAHHQRDGGRKHGSHHGKGDKIDNKTLAERRIGRLMTRATFLSFLMWTFVLFAACIGHRVSKFQENTRWIRCTYKKSFVMLLIASLFGAWKLHVNSQIMTQMHRYHKQMDRKQNKDTQNNMWKPKNKQRDQFIDEIDAQMELFNQIFAQVDQQQRGQREKTFSSNKGRHLGAASEGRRLRSSFDVFDFVNNAIDSGVKKAHHNQNHALNKDVGQFFGPIVQDVQTVVAKAEHEIEHELSALAEKPATPVEQAPTEQAPVEQAPESKTHIVQMAEPTEVVEPIQEEITIEPIAEIEKQIEILESVEIIEEPVEVLAVEIEPVAEVDMFKIEEIAAMQALADMGRLFDDADEAKMLKLTEDLTAWMNKWAPTLDDAESVLFEVTGSLVTEEMQEAEEPVDSDIVVVHEEPIIDYATEEIFAPEPEVMPLAEETFDFTITFSFGEGNDWFVFEQTTFVENGEEDAFTTLDFDNLWAEMTNNLNDFDDWARLNDDEWNKLVDLPYLQDEEIDAIIEDLFMQEDMKKFEQELAPQNVDELSYEEIQQLFNEKTPSEFKLVLDKMDSFEKIVNVFENLTDAQLFAYFTQLSDKAWKQTTPEEWRAYVVFLDTDGFKGILDYMTVEEIVYVWQFFDDWMTDKFMEGLTTDKWFFMTQAEWQASFLLMSPSDFKQFFFDQMDLDQILYTSSMLGDMDQFLDGLSEEDWKSLTQAEWEATLMDADIEDLVDFIHEMYELNPYIVFDMFRNMPRDMLEDFRDTPELSAEFSFEELQAIKKGVDNNISNKDSIYDDDMDFEKRRPHKKDGHKKDGHKKDSHKKDGHKKDGHKKDGHKKDGHKKDGDKKRHENDKPRHPENERPPRPEGDRKHHPKDEKKGHKGKKHHDRKPFEENPENFYYDDAFIWFMDNEDFIIDDFDFADGLDELMQEEIWQAQIESEQSTRDGDWSSSDDFSSDSDSSSDSSSDSNSDSDSMSDSDSDSSSDLEFLKNKKRKNGKKNKKNKKVKQSKKQKKAKKHEKDLPATLEDVEQPINLTNIPQESVDRRHGGRHLKGCGKRAGGRGGHHEGRRGEGHRNGDHHNGKHGHHKQGRREHHGKGHMKWCLAVGALIYATIMGTFLFVFKKFVRTFSSYHTLNEVHAKAADKSIEERNKMYEDYRNASRCCRRVVRRQVAQAQQQQPRQQVPDEAPRALYYPPELDGALDRQPLIQEERPADCENVPAPRVVHQPQSQQATYTLDQVKALLALERERLARAQQ